jgi:hypothetical protein
MFIQRRSYAQQLPGRRTGAAALLAASVAAALLVVASSATGADGDRHWPREPYPASARVEAAREFAAAAAGTVSFAVLDSDAGLRGLDASNQFSSASVSKVLLLAAELRRLRREGEPLDESTRSLLDAMITYSDNDAASSIYARVGDEAMRDVAERSGMRSFEVTPGYWGGAQLTAADLARFFYALDRNLAGPHRRYAKGLLAGITSSQRWGIPEGVGAGWTVRFKGGWRPAATEETSGPVTHQAALLTHRSGRRVGVAVLTDLAPGSTSYAILEGIARRLFATPPRPREWPAA